MRELAIVLGRLIGEYEGWEEAEAGQLMLLNFAPASGIPFPETPCLNLDFNTGIAQVWNDEGEKIGEWDIMETLRDLPRHSDGQA